MPPTAETTPRPERPAAGSDPAPAGPGAPALLAGAVALAAALRFTWLDARGWWRDEAVTVELLRLPFTGLLRAIPDSEGTPPLYYVLAWGWTRLVGAGEPGLRSLSALLGTLTVLVVYAVGRELVSRRTGLCAAFLAAASPLLVWHAQDGRSYSLLVLLAALSLLFFVRLLRRPRRRDAAAWGVAASLALLTHYFAVFAVLPQAAWLLLSRRTRRPAAPAVAAAALVGLALVPLARAQSGNVSWIAEVPRWRRLLEVVEEFLVGPQAPHARAATAAAGLVVLLALGLLLLRGSDGERRAVVPAAAIGAAALAMPLGLVLPGLDYVLARNLIVAWVPLAVVAAAGLTVARARVAGAVAAAALVALGVAVVVASADEPKFALEDWRGAARALGPPPAGGRAIVLWPAVGLDPFLLYRPAARPLPTGGASVSEVVVVALGKRRAAVERYGSELFPPAPFARAGRRDARYFTLVRFSAGEPRLVTAERLVATRPGTPHAVVLLERPVAGARDG